MANQNLAAAKTKSAFSKGMIIMYFYTAVAMVNSACNGYDGSLMGSINAMSQYNGYFNQYQDCVVVTDGTGAPCGPSDSITGLVMSINAVGTILATPVSGWLCDKYGRRWSMALGSAIICVAAILQSAAVHIAMIVVGRFLLGFGSAITGVASPTLITEMAPARMRGRLTGTYNCFWYAGSLIAAGVTFGTLSMESTGAFRIPLALQALPSLVNLSLVWFISESPRWLVANNREEEAMKLLVKLHSDGDESDPVAKAEFDEIKHTIEEERKIKRSGWYELIATPGNRYRMMLNVCVGLFGQWSGNNLVSYYLPRVLSESGITNTHTQLLINVIVNIWNFCCAITGTILIDFIGRRPMVIFATAMSTLWLMMLCIFTALYGGTGQQGITMVAFVFLFYGLFSSGWTPMQALYPVEVLSYPMRANGMAANAFFANIAQFVNQFATPVALTNIGWRFYIVYVVWDAFELFVVTKYFVETKGRTLEDLDHIFNKTTPHDLEFAEKSGSISEDGETKNEKN
ncbi:general substrate transporter [Umbelopsis sp. PMI_123]|nr:general substrate transporter [Umbelopsis sp. PMI_123]